MSTEARPVDETATRLWKDKLEPGVTVVLRGGQPLTYEAHSAMYTVVYDCVTSTKHMKNPMRDPGILHTLLSDFLAAHTTEICAGAPEDDIRLPAYYDTQWDVFSHACATLDRLFACLNKYYVGRLRAEGQKSVLPAGKLGMTHWKTNVFDVLTPRLATALGETAKLDAVRSLLASDNLAAANFKEMRLQAA